MTEQSPGIRDVPDNLPQEKEPVAGEEKKDKSEGYKKDGYLPGYKGEEEEEE